MAINANFNQPFLPQEGITSQILASINQANEQHAQEQAAAARQKQLSIAQQEANTASQRLAIETPGITAQGQDAQNQLALHAKILEGFNPDHPDSQAPLSTDHVYGIAGQHAVVPPEQLNVSNPLGQTLSAPGQPTTTGQARNLYQRHADAVGQAIGGFTPSEQRDVELAYQKFSANPGAKSLGEYQQDVANIVKRRDNPDYAKQVQYEQGGMSEYDAKRAVQHDNAVASTLTALESDPSKMTGPNARAAQAQLASLAKEPGLSDQTQQRVAALQKVADVAVQNASTTDFEAWREAYKREHNGQEPTAAAVRDFKTAGQQAIVQGRGDITNKDYYDTKEGSVVQMTPNEFNATKKDDPIRFVEYNGTVQKNLGAHSLINGIRDSLSSLASDYGDTTKPQKYDASTTAIMGAALRAKDESTFSTLKGRIAFENLNPEQTQHINNLLQLHERLMSLRGLQSAGAGSESQRDAIFALAPTLADSPSSAKQKLASLTNEIQNVEAGFPKIGKSNVSAKEKSGSTPKKDSLGIF